MLSTEYKIEKLVALPSIASTMSFWDKINTPIMCFHNKGLPLDWITYNFFPRSNQTDLINAAASYINQDSQLVHHFHTSSILDAALTNFVIGASERLAFNFFASLKNRYPKKFQNSPAFPLALYTASKFLSVSAMYLIYALPSVDFEIYIMTEAFMTILGVTLGNKYSLLKPLSYFYLPHYKDTASFFEFLPTTGLYFGITSLLYFISTQSSNVNFLREIQQLSSISSMESTQIEKGGFFIIQRDNQRMAICDMNAESYVEYYYLVNLFEDFGRLIGRLFIDLSMFFMHKLGLIDSLKTPTLSNTPLDNFRNLYFRSSAKVSIIEERDTSMTKKRTSDNLKSKLYLEDYVDGFTEDNPVHQSDSNLTQGRKEHRKNVKEQKRKKDQESESFDITVNQKILTTKLDLCIKYQGINRAFHLLPEYSSTTSLTYAIILPQHNNLTLDEYKLYEDSLRQKQGIAVKKLISLNKKQKDNLSVEIKTSQDSRLLGYWKARSNVDVILSEIFPHSQVRKSIITDLDKVTSEILGNHKNEKWNLMIFTHQNHGHKK